MYYYQVYTFIHPYTYPKCMKTRHLCHKLSITGWYGFYTKVLTVFYLFNPFKIPLIVIYPIYPDIYLPDLLSYIGRYVPGSSKETQDMKTKQTNRLEKRLRLVPRAPRHVVQE